MDWLDFQKLLDKAFEREPVLADWPGFDPTIREKLAEIDAMILEELADMGEDVWA